MKKVLIITYYWPPSGGAGVQRWVKFVKYLEKFEWKPIVFTPENPERPVDDKSLLNEIPENTVIIKNRIWEPYSFYKRFTGKRDEEKIQTAFLAERQNKNRSIEKMSIWIRGNLFIPDARKYWIRPSVKFLTKYIRQNPVDAIVTTGPPHSTHLIGMALNEKMKIPWLADFRDPWTNIDYYQDLNPGKRANRIHHKLEKQVLQKANSVSVISPGMESDFNSIFRRDYHIIPNGFDAEDIKGLPDIKMSKEKFILAHIGSLTKTRNPENLWRALQLLCEENEEFADRLEIQNIGKLDFRVINSLKNAKLEHKLVKIDYLPHDEVLLAQRKANLLLLLINDTPNAHLILTGKLFEYLSAKRQIICIGPTNGDAAKVISKTNSGHTYNFNEVNGLKNDLRSVFEQFKTGTIKVESKNLMQFERKNLTKKMAQVLNSCIASQSGSG